jgi:putative transcriptional regulator
MSSGHPTKEMLDAYALGTAPEGEALLVAAHATYCAACRAAIARRERLAGAALAGGPFGPMRPGALDTVMGRLDDQESPVAVRGGDGMLPAPIVAVAGRFDTLRWRFVMPGVSKVDIPVAGDEAVTLLRVRPGCGVPQHTHTAQEATLVLSGALRDRGRVYRRGDVAVATDDDDHTPSAEPGADCVCLAVLSGALRFTGAFGRALNMFAQ